MAKTETKKMSSWWWATHISSRNSKWLQENLADMDSKVKQMIKLIEVDEDSFARRAEMYYKKRPELMNLVEEFYRVYRSLAERYDHSTGVIKHAQKTISEAFPNQINFLDSDDPDFSGQFQAPFLSKKIDQDPPESPRLERFEADIQALKEAFSKLEVEKEKGSRLSSLESKVFLEKIDVLERTNASKEIEIAEMNTFLVKSLFDVNVENQELELKLSQLEHELVDTKIMLCKKEMDLIQEQLEAERVVETLCFDLKIRKDEAELWESIACTSFVELQKSSVCELVYREKVFELAEIYQWLLDRSNSDEKNGQVQQPQCDGFLAAMEAIRDSVASLERHIFGTEVSNGHNEDVTTSKTSDVVSDLHDIALRIKAIDDNIKESKRTPEEQLENEHQDTVSNHLNPTLELQEDEDELKLKDIMLDQASENSSSRKNISQTFRYDDEQIPIPPIENRYYNNDALEMLVEKELRVDSLELSKRYTEPNILERLSMDIQKLQSLEKIVHGLKESGYADVKERIKDTEKAIAKLIDENGKIMKHIEDCEATSSPIGDHVRKWCEKIGRLEVEVEKIQFLVVKLNASNKVDEVAGKKVALRDYLYGSGAHERRRKKAWLCGCVKAKTRRD